MSALFRGCALALCAVVLVLLLRKTNPELAFALSLLTAVGVLGAAVGELSGLKELTSLVRERFEVPETALLPVLKCLGLSVVTRLSSDLCRDSSQAAAAGAVELAGAACALGVVLPLILQALKAVGGLL